MILNHLTGARPRDRLEDLEQRQPIDEATSSQYSPGYIRQPSDTQTSISSMALGCNILLESLIDTAQALQESQPEQGSPAELCHLLEDELGRFRVWAANLGAFQDPNSPRSLEYRLRDGPVMRSSVVSGLKRLMDTGDRGMYASWAISPSKFRSELCEIIVGGIMEGKRPNRSAPAAADASVTEDSPEAASKRTTEL